MSVALHGLPAGFLLLAAAAFSECCRAASGDLRSLAQNASNILLTAFEQSQTTTCLASSLGNLSNQLPPLQLSPTAAQQLLTYKEQVSSFYYKLLFVQMPGLQVSLGHTTQSFVMLLAVSEHHF